MMTRDEALAIVRGLPAEVREAIALVVETAEVQGDYMWNGEDSVWTDSANLTLYELAKEIRGN